MDRLRRCDHDGRMIWNPRERAASSVDVLDQPTISPRPFTRPARPFAPQIESTEVGSSVLDAPGLGSGPTDAIAVDPWIAAPPRATTTRVHLIGTHLRAEGAVELGNFRRLSDYVNLLDGFFTIHDVVLLSRLGEPTRITFPDFRVRLDDIAIVGQAHPSESTSEDRLIPKQRRRLVLTTGAHIIYGYAYLHEQASLTAFVDSTDPEFMPMTNVRVRWLADRRLAGRFPFALIQRRKIIGVATEVSGGLSLLEGRRPTGSTV